MVPILFIILGIFILLILKFIIFYILKLILQPLKILYNTLERNIRALAVYFRTFLFVKKCYYQNLTVIDFFQKNAEKHPDEVCCIFEDEEWTYKQINDLSDKIAYCFKLQNYYKEDEMALFMENCPEYICIWLGLAKIGVITALIDISQNADSLAHSINAINAKGIIFGHNLSKSLIKAMHLFHRKNIVNFYCYSRKSEKIPFLLPFFQNLNDLLAYSSTTLLYKENFKTNFQDKLMYIYTSEIIGFSKPAVIRHNRVLWHAGALRSITHGKSEIYYNPLPMYHTTGGLLFLNVVLIFGGKIVLKKNFTGENFWKEVAKHKVTVFQYTGEICRCLLNQPKVPEECHNSVYMMLGNGLKPPFWEEFQERFKVPKIIETYGSTEGIITLFNLCGKAGAVGFISRIFSWLYPVRLVKVDIETGELLRDENGLCITCKAGNNLIMDEDVYIYFLDRIGDTFEWKDETISTSEVKSVISETLNPESCVVYGLQISDTEDRSSTAAIQTNLNEIDFHNLHKKTSFSYCSNFAGNI